MTRKRFDDLFGTDRGSEPKPPWWQVAASADPPLDRLTRWLDAALAGNNEGLRHVQGRHYDQLNMVQSLSRRMTGDTLMLEAETSAWVLRHWPEELRWHDPKYEGWTWGVLTEGADR